MGARRVTRSSAEAPDGSRRAGHVHAQGAEPRLLPRRRCRSESRTRRTGCPAQPSRRGPQSDSAGAGRCSSPTTTHHLPPASRHFTMVRIACSMPCAPTSTGDGAVPLRPCRQNRAAGRPRGGTSATAASGGAAAGASTARGALVADDAALSQSCCCGHSCRTLDDRAVRTGAGASIAVPLAMRRDAVVQPNGRLEPGYGCESAESEVGGSERFHRQLRISTTDARLLHRSGCTPRGASWATSAESRSRRRTPRS